MNRLLPFDGNRSFRQRVVSLTAVLQTLLISSQTCKSQFANVEKSVRKRYKDLHVKLGLTI